VGRTLRLDAPLVSQRYGLRVCPATCGRSPRKPHSSPSKIAVRNSRCSRQPLQGLVRSKQTCDPGWMLIREPLPNRGSSNPDRAPAGGDHAAAAAGLCVDLTREAGTSWAAPVGDPQPIPLVNTPAAVARSENDPSTVRAGRRNTRELVRQRNLAITANTYTLMLVDQNEIDYAALSSS
jgi:hypothetical protein